MDQQQTPNQQPASDSSYGPYGPAPSVASVNTDTGHMPIGEQAGYTPAVSGGQPVGQQPQQQYANPMQPQPGMQQPQQAPQQPPQPKSNPNSTQNTLQIAEIRDGIVIMNDGSFRSVVMLKSINFDLMSPEEREAVEYSYQGFLNSLYFEVQIFIRSQRVDLRPYLEKLDKVRSEHDNMLLAVLMDDYVNFVADLSAETNIMDKRFYVAIPYFPEGADVKAALVQSKSFFSGLTSIFNSKEQHVTINEADLNKAKDELKNRTQAVLNGLSQAGVQGLPLDTQELIELYYDSYNPDTATRQQLKNFSDMSAPVVEKGQGAAPQPNLERTLE